MDVSQDRDEGALARSVFSGLEPRCHAVASLRPDRASQVPRAARATVPIVMVGSIALALNLTGAISPVMAKPVPKPRGDVAELSKSPRPTFGQQPIARQAQGVHPSANALRATTTAGPTAYRVIVGDTVSDIAERFNLSTVSVLALNGLSWSSLIFPGQELVLTRNGSTDSYGSTSIAPPGPGHYSIVAGDTITSVADRFGVSTLSVLTANGLGWSSIIYPGQIIAIPGLTDPSSLANDSPTETPHTPEPTRSESAGQPLVEPVPPVAEQVIAAPSTPAEGSTTTAPPSPPPATGSYTVLSGDTLSGIATRYSISTQSLLDANGLSSTSVIYPGNVLAIPGGSIPPSSGADTTSLNDEMRSNAAVIVQVGRELGVPDYGIVIALATAMQESSLRNLSWGDRDSVGLFQQRPSSGWGTVEQLTSPVHAARLFYGGPSNPNTGRTRGLLDISGWQSLSLTRAAQAVQISGYPDAYAKWESSARQWFAELG